MNNYGILYIVPTPIGNMGDMTFRSVEVLKDVDYVFAEDTRESLKLFRHYEIQNKLKSFHLHNEHHSTPGVLKLLCEGHDVALISDAGTPGISDPGFLLIREAIVKDIKVVTLPGATALVPAVVNSGIPCEKFLYEGFLPPKKGRNKRLSQLSQETSTMIFYESPHRITKALNEFKLHFGGDRRMCLCREISKMYEEYRRGTVDEILQRVESDIPKGEIVLIVEGKQA